MKKNKKNKKNAKSLYFFSRSAYANCAIMVMLYILFRLEISYRTRWWCLKYVILYLARDIPGYKLPEAICFCFYKDEMLQLHN